MLDNIVESKVWISEQQQAAAYLSIQGSRPDCLDPLVESYPDSPPPIFYLNLHYNISLAHCCKAWKITFHSSIRPVCIFYKSIILVFPLFVRLEKGWYNHLGTLSALLLFSPLNNACLQGVHLKGCLFWSSSTRNSIGRLSSPLKKRLDVAILGGSVEVLK